MGTQTTTAQVNDQILGYKLTRKIGSGGYGDVWEADAPGGLKKALKIVFGFYDERRAQSELKALDRIKQARHPFLLSLERIEIYNSQLIVVSELADKSLSDLANEYRLDNGEGVPREELIGYMKETADALDYLNAEFQLQHLDIKPENILIVSGHAKVADFGLVKEIKEHTQSLMAGMTPAYAAPELFDGQPGPASDQYSLAVVYQEMLTTQRPFSGTTTAQLAVQHMHGKPDLRLLPIGDQAVISKALSKSPEERYPNCHEFVKQLASRKSRKKAVKSRVTIREAADTSCNTVVFQEDSLHSTDMRTDLVSTAGLKFKSTDIQSFAPPECDPDAAVFQPTVVIAVGESSAKVVRKFKQRLVDRFGSMEALPAINFLCIDADNDSLANLSHVAKGCSLSVSETLAVPLRRPEQYRKIASLDLSWLSRRWIYNVPRSLKIQGLRPLGRLVFADHFEKICDRISQCIKHSIQPENLSKSCQLLELNPPENIRPNVILVSNISGGIGSGMTNDLAYTIRLMLAENGIGDAKLTGILMHGVKAGREVSLATANSYAYLSELRHFADAGYPGDQRLGIPEFEDELPFDFTYGIRLNLNSEEKKSDDLDRISDYLFLSTATRSSVFFEATRAREYDNDEFALRTFGLGISGPGNRNQGQAIIERLSQGVVEHWIHGPSENFDATQFVIGLAEHLKLDANFATTKVTAAIVSTPEWEAIQSDIEDSPKLFKTGAVKRFVDLKLYFDEIYGAPIQGQDCGSESTEFNFAVEPEIVEIGQQLGDEICQKILDMINGDEVNFSRVNAAIEACFQFIDCQLQEAKNNCHGHQRKLASMMEPFDRLTQLPDDENQLQVELMIMQYSKVRLQEFAARNCHLLFRVIKATLSSTAEIINKMKMQLEYIGQQFEVPEEPARSPRSKVNIQKLLIDQVKNRHQDMVKLAQQIVVKSITADDPDCKGFLDLMHKGVAWQKRIPDTIRHVAEAVMWCEFKQLNVDEILAKKNISESDTKRWLSHLLNSAIPFVSDCGGAATLLYAFPRFAGESKLPEFINSAFDVQAIGLPSSFGNILMCFEAEGILLANFAFSILKDAPEAAELARRIPTRDDIRWSNLEDLMA